MTRTRNAACHLVKVLIVSLATCYSAYIVHTILTASAEHRVQFVPDDAYYYMTLARNFATQGLWTFDSGVSLTTGFHPLHAYALAAIYALTRTSAEHFVEISILLSSMVAVPAAIAASALAFRCKRLFPSLLLLLLVLSRNVSLNLVSAVEWSWVVSLSTLYCVMFSKLDRYRNKIAFPLLIGCGLLGSLARTDFGLLPAALVAASLPSIRTPAGRRRFTGVLVGFAGACTGVIAGLLLNYITTGQYLQSSARMKSLWLETCGPSSEPIFMLVFLFGPTSKATLIFCVMLAPAVLILGRRCFLRHWLLQLQGESSTTQNVCPLECALWFGSLLAIFGYITFYSLNPAGLQHWYTANLLAPVFLALCLPIMRTRPSNPLATAAVVLVILLLCQQVARARHFSSRPEWAHQVYMYRAGHYLREANLGGRVGSWNAGIIGFYQGGSVVNLDGLVNNDIYGYAAQDRLPEYIDAISIRYVLDFENMVSSEYLRRRGGYDIPGFLERLEPVRRFDDRDHGWRRLTLFKVAPSEGPMPEAFSALDKE